VRRHTVAAHTHVGIFTGHGRGSVTMADPTLAADLRASEVQLLEADFSDRAGRVAHTERSRFVHCVVRNRWFVIRDYLRVHAGTYERVLMSDVRDAIIQANPFTWTPPGEASASRSTLTGFRWDRAVIFSGEGSGAVRTLRQSKKGVPRTLSCASGATEDQRKMLLDTDPLNAGVTAGGAEAFLNFSTALATLISRVTTRECLQVKDCTDQGLYNLLVYAHWDASLPHTRRVVLPIERAYSYTLGHRKRCPTVDADGRVRNGLNELPPVVHQFAKGGAGKALHKTRFATRFLRELSTSAWTPVAASRHEDTAAR
jgi:hypothetical protein